MLETYFALAGAVVACFTSDSDFSFNDDEMLRLEGHLPGIRKTEAVQHTDIHITHLERSPFRMLQGSQQFLIEEPWKAKLSPDFSHILYSLARKAWIRKGIFPVHGACVGNEKGYVLLVGAAGAGKTSTALECAKTHGLRLFSGDKTLVQVDADGKLIGIAGTRAMTVRDSDRHRWDPLIADSVQLGDRRCFHLKEDYLPTAEKVHIKAIVLLSLNEGYPARQTLQPLSALHTVYPYFMDMERADILLGDGAAILDGAVDPNDKKLHVPQLADSIKKTPTLKVTGSMNDVTSVILETLERV